ncbi:hypothetical protein JKF63_04424 [Porcisia hertigi]|uniref:BTB domain-containing protein n=1 Tax=Porcisia hertigi TaxID=2761500 RepID=A0A836IGI3_9TRYP|nr:hypothetical protein JKF63_04424 [Porcisia hertigi]
MPTLPNITSDAAMHLNQYPIPMEDEVDARDIAALLAELQDVGRTAANGRDAANTAPHSHPRDGVGEGGTGTNTRAHPCSGSAARLGHSSSTAVAASKALAPVGFSTYNSADAGLSDAQHDSQRLSATPLGVRLTPLGGGDSATNPYPIPSPPPATHRQAAAPTSPYRANAVASAGAPRPSLTPQSALPPLPSLAARALGAASSSATGSGGDPTKVTPSSVLPAVSTWPTSSDATASDKGRTPSKAPAVVADVVATATPSALAAPREVNFLPVMCARYLRPVGLTPTARLGHTLTPVTPETLLLFGGLDVHGEETASLMAFNVTNTSWEPLYTHSGAPVARYSHAACAYDGRYLVISGGVAQHGNEVLNDIHIYDLHTHQWRCVWDGQRDGSLENRNEPGPRFGHTMVLHDDRLYLYGGKTTSESRLHTQRGSGSGGATSATTAAATLASGLDVYVFSLNTYRWRRRVRTVKERSIFPAAQNAGVDGEDVSAEAQLEVRARPAARVFHAACIRGNTMYINGGSGVSEVLTDTWSVHLSTGEWHCVHRGGTADAIPREKHAIFVCGEALLLVGGCSSGSVLHERITGKFTHFAVVLPLVGTAVNTPCWIPVAMGNMSIVQPHKKSFAAALTGGFVYVFGGVSGAEPATNSMVRFLAADGYVSENDPVSGHSSVGDGSMQRLRLKLQQLQEQQRGTPFDCYVYAGTYGSADVASAIARLPGPWSLGGSGEDVGLQKRHQHVKGGEEDVPIAGLHRAIVQQRAPLLLKQLEACRSELYNCGGGAVSCNAKAPLQQHHTSSGSVSDTETRGQGDEVDVLLRQVAEGHRGGATKTISTLSPSKGGSAAAGASVGGAAGGLPVYFTNGTARVPGLEHSLTADALQCIIDYVYWGGLKAEYRALLEEERDEDDDGGVEANGKRPTESTSAISFTTEYRLRLVRTLECVKAVGEAYALAPLAAICAGLLAGDREQVRLARQRSGEQLCSDMAALLSAPSTGPNTTMLVVDPHTKEQSAHVLHACVLLTASDFFTELLRPLYRAVIGGTACGGKSFNQVGSLSAKLSTAAAASPLALLTSSSKRTLLIGPVPLPIPAVHPILRYLYTQQLQVSDEIAFEVMLGAHELGLTELQALCEAVVARQEVNYQSCCSLYYLARKHQAPLLEEIALLTAVSGFAEVSHTSAYQSLLEEEKMQIKAVAEELGSSTWLPPPPPREMKSKAAYSALWNASAPSTL